MKTKLRLQTIGLNILIMLLTTTYTNAQIYIQGLAANHEGIACWDADGSGPEPEAYGHIHPYGYGSALYYAASRDYVDPDTIAALCHFQDNITGFPLFVQALTDNGFTAGQVKIKTGLFTLKDDIEGEDWFTHNDAHYVNRYDAYYHIELNGELMLSGYFNYFQIHITSTGSYWQSESNFTRPADASAGSSQEVQAVAASFLMDMGNEELRFVVNSSTVVGAFGGNGRIGGSYFNINSGYLKKGLPELPFVGLGADHEGLACWNADGTGPEPEAYGHTFWYGGTEYWTPYYIASRDYDDIDPDPDAALCHFIGDPIGFPNLELQLAYRGYTLDQLKAKHGLTSMGDDIEGEDWGLDENIHWYHYYNTPVTIEIANEPILECVIDTNFGFWDMDNVYDNWWSYTNYATLSDISSNASSGAQYVATSFLKDLGGHSIQIFADGNFDSNMPLVNGRDGDFHYMEGDRMEARLPAGTHIWEGEVRGTWDIEGSPYIVMGKIYVPDAEMLIIEPGVVIKFNTKEMFLIDGCIIAEGTEDNPILFTALDNSVKWGGIGWDQTSTSNVPSSIKHCIFEYAYAYDLENIYGYNCGGAIRVNTYDQIEISHSTFRYNLADKFTVNNPCGGAIVLGACSVPISHCIFHDNTSCWGGAIAMTAGASPVIDNCLFYNNAATYDDGGSGGAILVYLDCYPHFVNCTFADNDANSFGGAVEIELGGETSFTNCIFWGNTAGNEGDQINVWDPANSLLNVYYSDVEEGLNGISPGFQGDYIENIASDPVFTTTGEFLYTLDEYLSPCIDSGTMDPLYLPTGWICPSYCLLGNPRISGPEIDMGCYEALHIGTNEFDGNESMALNVVPNPVNTNASIEFYLMKDGLASISIMDIHGKVVSEILLPDSQKGKNSLLWNAENLNSGVYFCVLKTNKGINAIKIMKN